MLVLESTAPGGQAGSSSRIENYLGFPTGISGQELAARAYTQAEKFGAQLMIARGAAELSCSRKPYALRLDDGQAVPARTIIIATGARYRKLAACEPRRSSRANGVYYGATFIEAQVCRGEEVVVVGRRATPPARRPCSSRRRRASVHVLVRGEGLADTMSRYLDPAHRGKPERSRCTRTRSSTRLEGNGHLERVALARQVHGRGRDARHPPRVRHGGRGAEHEVARWLRRARRQGLHQDRA